MTLTSIKCDLSEKGSTPYLRISRPSSVDAWDAGEGGGINGGDGAPGRHTDALLKGNGKGVYVHKIESGEYKKREKWVWQCQNGLGNVQPL